MMRRACYWPLIYLARMSEFIDRWRSCPGRVARDLSAARNKLGGLPEELSGANEHDRLAADTCCGRAGLAVNCRELVGMVSLSITIWIPGRIGPLLGGLLVLRMGNHGVGNKC